MKILIIGFAKIKYMPYLNLYLDNINTSLNDVHVLYWERDTSTDRALPDNVTPHVFKELLADEIPKYAKIKAFLNFGKYAKKLIKKHDFDFIIVLTSVPAVIISDVLTGKYKNRYIYDYRDYTFESFLPYKKCVAKLVENSFFTVVSSEKYKEFLPESKKIYTIHNLLQDSLLHRNTKPLSKRSENQPLRFSYWGIIRNEGLNKSVISKLANDDRFRITFYGRKQATAMNLEKYCIENGIKNVRFTGEYQEEDRYNFVKETDILYNLYNISGTEGMAMGNKYYDGIIFYLPQICTQGSFMGEKITEKGIGAAFDPASDTFADDIYNYYHNLELNEFKHNCDKELDTVLKEYNAVVEKLHKICNREKSDGKN